MESTQEKETFVGFLRGTVLPIVGGAGCGAAVYASTGSKLIAVLCAFPGAVVVQLSFCVALAALAKRIRSKK